MLFERPDNEMINEPIWKMPYIYDDPNCIAKFKMIMENSSKKEMIKHGMNNEQEEEKT